MRRFSRAAVARRFVRAHAAALLIAIGCAHAEAPPPSPPSAPAPAPSAPADTVVPGPGPEGRLDPSEEITPEELATIPEPVPRAAAREETAREPAPRSAPPVEAPSSAASADSRWVWRVQVFASPDRDQAERVAREASSRLGEPHVLERESSLYKVRLGSFASEAEAQELRDRAVHAGFAGAFLVRSTVGVNALE